MKYFNSLGHKATVRRMDKSVRAVYPRNSRAFALHWHKHELRATLIILMTALIVSMRYLRPWSEIVTLKKCSSRNGWSSLILIRLSFKVNVAYTYQVAHTCA